MTTATEKRARLRRLLEGDRLVVSPGVYDGYSARLVEQLGYETASTTGAGLANSRLSMPDVGLMSMLENVEACRALARSVDIPLMADADDGYGNPVTVHHVIRQFEEAGVAGVNIEDQAHPKRCGHLAGKSLVPVADMCQKLTAAAEARTDEAFVVNARTDAVDVEGLDAAIARARAYASAGADMIFPDAVRGEEDIRRFVDAVDVPVSVNMGFGLRTRSTTPLMSLRHLEALGVRRVTLPRMLTAAAITGMRRALEALADGRDADLPNERPELVASMDDIMQLMGYDAIDRLEERYGTGPYQGAPATG